MKGARSYCFSLALALATLGAVGCDHESLTTDTHSRDLKTSSERLRFLSRYLKLRSPATDASFHIVYHDNSGGLLPGPSDWSITAALQLAPADAPKWLLGAKPELDNHSIPLLPPPRLIPAAWGVTSAGQRYRRDGALLIWHEEGVLEFSARSELEP